MRIQVEYGRGTQGSLYCMVLCDIMYLECLELKNGQLKMDRESSGIDLSNWITQVRKGVLELCIVTLLARGEMYGYDLVKRLARIRGLVITEGTVYPLLSRLRAAGLLETRLEESTSGPARKYYALTSDGERAMGLMKTYWKELVDGVSSLLESEAEHG